MCGKEVGKKGVKFCSHKCYWKSKIGKKHSWGESISRSLKGVKKSKDHVEKVRLALTGKKRPYFSGHNHPFWKGDKVSYGTLHDWVSHHKGRPSKCSKCKITEGLFQWSNISGLYKRDLSDWKRLCVKCHRRMDKNKNRAGLVFKKKDNKYYRDRVS